MAAKDDSAGEFPNAATPLHRELLRQIEQLAHSKGYTSMTKAMEDAGSSRSNWDYLRNGQSPKLVTLEEVVRKLGGSLTVRVLPEGVTAESIEIMAMVDTVPEETVREQIAEMVAKFVANYSAARATKKASKA